MSHCGQGFVVAEAYQALSVSFKWTSAGVLDKRKVCVLNRRQRR